MTTMIDRQTFARVLAADPRLPFAPEILSRDVLRILQGEMDEPLYANEYRYGQAQTWEMHVKNLAFLLGEGISPAQAGRMVRKLGLRSERFRDGYHFFWNLAQVEILERALGVGRAAAETEGEAQK